MEKIKVKLRRSSERGIFHDSKADARLIAMVLNLAIDKIDQLVEANNTLQEQVNELTRLTTITAKQ